MRDVGKFTQSKPGNRFHSPVGAVSGEVLYTPVSAPNCGALCIANEKQKIANRQYYGFPSNSIFANGFSNVDISKPRNVLGQDWYIY